MEWKIGAIELLVITVMCAYISKRLGEKFFVILAIMIDISTILLYITALCR